MLVGVDMVERQSGRAEGLKLRADLARELPPHSRQEKKAETGSHHPVVEVAGFIDEIADRVEWCNRASFDQYEMQANPQAGQPPGPRHCVFRRRCAHHQTGAGQDTVAMGGFDRLVDCRMESEIVSADDELPQLAICRSRRKWKNSTPSRRRRFIIVGLRTISLTIEAILPARK